jgi:hypothetical protein
MSDGANDHGLSIEQRRTLASVLDEIIPPSADGRLPGAGQVGLDGAIEQALRGMPELRAMIADGLAELERHADSAHGATFAALSSPDKVQLLNQQAFVLPLTFQTYVAYYQHPRVTAALGLAQRPPHPEGYAMEPNDPSLLEPVRRRDKMYREC